MKALDLLAIPIAWQAAPFDQLTEAQLTDLREQSEVFSYSLAEVIWATKIRGYRFLLITGKARLWEEGQSAPVKTLQPGDWFGDFTEVAVDMKVTAGSEETVVLRCPSSPWAAMLFPETADHVTPIEAEIQAKYASAPEPSYSYPLISHGNTGVACLTMLTQYLGNPVSLEVAQRQLRGQRPPHLVEAADKLGLTLRKLRINYQDLSRLSFPLLLHWHQKTWVVAYGLKNGRLVIGNPLNPNRTCERVDGLALESAWNGFAWQVELTQRREQFNLGWFLPAVWQYRGLLAEVLLASLTLQVLGLASPVITQVVVDKVMVQGSLSTLDVLAIALLGAAIFEAVLGILRTFIFTHTARRLDLKLSAQVFSHLMRLPLAYFESRRVGDTVARVQELTNIRQFLTGTALTVVLDVLFVGVYLALMFFYSAFLTWISLTVIPLFVLLTFVATPILRNWLNESFNRNADSQSFLTETITGIHAVKSHGAELLARERWEGLFARYIRTNFKASTTSNISSNLGDFLTNFSALLILWFGARLVINQDLTIGQLVAFQMLSARVTGPLLRLVQLWQNLQQVLLSVARIGDILNTAPELEPGAGLILPDLKGQITFESVDFRYHPDDRPVLRQISFTIEPGMLVGVVGRSGSGKSTISKLLHGLYVPESGRILVDGFDLRNVDPASLRRQISVVLQEDYLFRGSILENIVLGNPELTIEQVMEAARLAMAHSFISSLPQGYETPIGERGVGLSVGQRQRIALTRLFLSDAPMLILDEATSALDSESEQVILQNLQAKFRDRTVLMITHRFQPLKRADLILVLQSGIIAESGTHEELLKQGGIYAMLYQRQKAQ